RPADQIDPAREIETEQAVVELDVELDVRQRDRRDLPEAVNELYPPRREPVEAEQHPFDIGGLDPRLEAQPVEALVAILVDDGEALAHRTVAAEQHRRRRRDRVVERGDGSLLQLAAERPEILAVRDDELLERLLVMPAEAARPLEREPARLRLDVNARVDALLELRGERRDLVEETLQQVAVRAVAALLRNGGLCGDEGESGQDRRGTQSGVPLSLGGAAAQGPP